MPIAPIAITPAVRAGSVLALDVGDKRIGVAVSRSWQLVMPLEAIRRTGRSAALDALEAVVKHHDARLLVVGLPLLEGGAEGEQAGRTRAFARSVSRRLPGLAIAYWDERYSTAEARDILGGGGSRTGQLDSVAAAVILREFLAAHPAPPTGAPASDPSR